MEVSSPESDDRAVLLRSSAQYGFVYVDDSRSVNLVAQSLRKLNSVNDKIQIGDELETNVEASKDVREQNSNWAPAVSERKVREVDERRPIVAPCVSFIEVESRGEAMIDAVDCRQRDVRHMGANIHHQNGGRDHPVSYVVGQNSGDMSNAVYSGGCSNGSTYTMLTPLKPLPSISTVSEQLCSNGSGYVYMHDCNGGINSTNAGNGSYHSYKYDTSEMHMPTNCNNYQSLPEASSGSSRLSNTGYMSTVASQYSTFGQPANCRVHSHPVKSEMMGSMNNMSCYDVPSGYTNNSRMVPSLPVEAQVKPSSGELTHPNMERQQVMHNSSSPQATGIMSPLHQSRAVIEHNRQIMPSQLRVGSPDQPSSSTDLHSSVKCARHAENEGSICGSEEISTRDVAQRVSNELKRYSIPQAVFAQRVLGRSQGTLSDLLRNPKPWSKLKSGRETFRRMWKWLQEPEYQRMASLRSSKYYFFASIIS